MSHQDLLSAALDECGLGDLFSNPVLPTLPLQSISPLIVLSLHQIVQDDLTTATSPLPPPTVVDRCSPDTVETGPVAAQVDTPFEPAEASQGAPVTVIPYVDSLPSANPIVAKQTDCGQSQTPIVTALNPAQFTVGLDPHISLTDRRCV